jgi:hypothetical protein
VYTNTNSHGFMVVDADAEELRVAIWEIPNTEVATSYYDDPAALDDLFQVVRFTVQDGDLIPGK